MTKEELIQFLKDNLGIRVTSHDGYMTVSLYIGDDFVCTDKVWISKGDSHVW